MLELTRPYGAPARPFQSPMISYGIAREAWELADYWQLRATIFCHEQALFDHRDGHADRDEHDVHAWPIVAVAHSAGTPERVVGVVRIFETADGVWYGGRLGVERDYRTARARHASVGALLIRTAVERAAANGCQQFFATVQEANARYFERFHFRARQAVEVCGTPHVLMEAELSAYVPKPDTHAHDQTERRSAA